jgi:hypothetical protein
MSRCSRTSRDSTSKSRLLIFSHKGRLARVFSQYISRSGIRITRQTTQILRKSELQQHLVYSRISISHKDRQLPILKTADIIIVIEQDDRWTSSNHLMNYEVVSPNEVEQTCISLSPQVAIESQIPQVKSNPPVSIGNKIMAHFICFAFSWSIMEPNPNCRRFERLIVDGSSLGLVILRRKLTGLIFSYAFHKTFPGNESDINCKVFSLAEPKLSEIESPMATSNITVLYRKDDGIDVRLW